MKKIQQVIMKDIGWKLLSVCIAVGLWFMVINIENPIDTRSYSQTIKFENEDILEKQGLTITNLSDFANSKVLIKVKAERSSLDRLSQYRNYIQATVDLKKATASIGNGESIPLNVEVKLPAAAGDNFEIVSKDPLTVSVKIETIVTAEKAVTAEIVGEVASGYVMSSPIVEPNTIKISGPESLVNEVSTVKARISINQPSKDTAIKAAFAAYDANGIEIEEIKMEPSEGTVTVPVSKSKKVLVKVSAQGLPRDGYIVEKIDWTPRFVEVVGNDTALSNLSEIVLPVINIQNQMETMEQAYDVSELLPNGVYIRSGTKDQVVVTVHIKKALEKKILIPADQIVLDGTLSDALKVTVYPQDITLTVKGSDEAMNAIDETKITGKVNIEGLTEGHYSIPIIFDLPEGISIVGEMPNSEIDIINETTTQPPQPLPSDEEQNTPSEGGQEQNTQDIPVNGTVTGEQEEPQLQQPESQPEQENTDTQPEE